MSRLLVIAAALLALSGALYSLHIYDKNKSLNELRSTLVSQAVLSAVEAEHAVMTRRLKAALEASADLKQRTEQADKSSALFEEGLVENVQFSIADTCVVDDDLYRQLR